MRCRGLVLGMLLFGTAQPLLAQENRFVNENGTTYKEVVQKVKVPVSETTYQTHTEKFYQERLTTDIQESQRAYLAPVTEYRWEAYTPFTLNVFAPPRIAYRYVPRTHWEQRTETVRTPVTRRELVPAERTVSRPVTTLKMVEREQVTRIAIAPPTQPAASVASRGSIGGVSNLQNDPPRIGTTSLTPMGNLRR
ncbi:hypothetical protein ACYFX5_13230 [Bremerella sp. T1]|uniref:hypothetical protein n=1 Tax=Bremerella sp. TYQ1 TaxID=3119568 RepID=UPI001CC98E1B|nr:hypothetical protein [Bremerella volcania]UBM34022.1 hypothetical protein LA756_15175 [Bremerella volcania]